MPYLKRITGVLGATALLCGLIWGILIFSLTFSAPSSLAQGLEPQPVELSKIIPKKMTSMPVPPDKTILDLKVDRVLLRQSSSQDVHGTLLKVMIPKGETMTVVLVDDEGRTTKLLIEQKPSDK